MSRSREWRLFRVGLIVADLAAYVLALILASHLSEHVWPTAHRSSEDLRCTILLLPVIPAIFWSQGLYDPHSLFGGTREYAAVLRSCTYSLVGVIIVSFAVRLYVSREWMVVSWLLSTALIGCLRFGLRRAVYRLRRRGLFVTRVLLVGADAQGVALAKRLMKPPSGVQIVGVLDDYLPVGALLAGGLRVVSTSDQLATIAARARADEVIVVPQALPWESLQIVAASAAYDGLRTNLLAGVYDLLASGVQLSRRNEVPLLTIRKAALSPGEAALKRVVDVTIAMGLLVLFAPIIALELALAAVTGNVLERRRVVGRNGQQFELISLPSNSISGPLVRKLPSLLQVLLGRLSVVGPHPAPAGEEGPKTTPRHMTTLRPGLTGLWRQSEDPAEQKLLDLYYVRGYSVWFDVQILLDRVKARFTRLRGDECANAAEKELPRLVTTSAPVEHALDQQCPTAWLEEQGAL